MSASPTIVAGTDKEIKSWSKEGSRWLHSLCWPASCAIQGCRVTSTDCMKKETCHLTSGSWTEWRPTSSQLDMKVRWGRPPAVSCSFCSWDLAEWCCSAGRRPLNAARQAEVSHSVSADYQPAEPFRSLFVLSGWRLRLLLCFPLLPLP